ncbi:MAG: hypothetical protein E6J73_15765 [Deltaproteobacteria bacterium]|nr:MAG: hypothetical protein E6J73_15765 [Deltaproteobacteria bacterium]
MNVGEPAIIAFADRDLPLGLIGNLLDEHSWIKHLDVDAELVHVLEPRRHVFHFSGFLRTVHVAAGALGHVGDLLRRQNDPHQAADLAVDVPIFAAALPARLDDQRAIFLIGLVDIVPGALRFNHVSIRIDGRHTI